jgi:hypothetical protein
MESNNKKQNIETVKAKMQTIFYNLDTKNNICADCGKIKSMDYASINNGIIICSQCAKEHMNLGYNISFVHSLGEKWDDYLFNYIKVGGNSRFIQFCKDYKLDKHNNNIKEKYKSKGLVYYRDILRSEVLGYDPPENINVNKAYEEEKEIPDNYPEFKKYSFVKHVDMNYLEKKFYTKKEEKEEEGLFGKIGDFFGNVKKNIENLEIVKKVQEIDIKDVKQKGADMFGYFFFGSNNKEDDKKEKKSDVIKNEEKKDSNDINDINDKNKKNDLKNIFGIDINKDNKNNTNEKIEEDNNKNIILNNEIGEKKETNENIKEIEDKIEIKEENKILTDNINNNIPENKNNINIEQKIEDNKKEINQNEENNNKEIENNKEKNGNENAIEEILKDDSLNKDDTKMNNEEKDELEKMLQE